jgi:predicted DCC family thiol-disulfide oxidoreductase YuxK
MQYALALIVIGLLCGHALLQTQPNHPRLKHSSQFILRLQSPKGADGEGAPSSYPERNPEIVRNLVLYDGVCGFCNTWVNVVLRLDRRGLIRFAALQSDLGRRALAQCGRARDDISSIVFLESINFGAVDGTSVPKHFIKSEAVVQVATRLGIPISLIATVLPLKFKDGAYDVVAENRYNILGKRDECRLTDPEYSSRFLS